MKQERAFGVLHMRKPRNGRWVGSFWRKITQLRKLARDSYRQELLWGDFKERAGWWQPTAAAPGSAFILPSCPLCPSMGLHRMEAALNGHSPKTWECPKAQDTCHWQPWSTLPLDLSAVIRGRPLQTDHSQGGSWEPQIPWRETGLQSAWASISNTLEFSNQIGISRKQKGLEEYL
jgi:hypothetical protein